MLIMAIPLVARIRARNTNRMISQSRFTPRSIPQLSVVVLCLICLTGCGSVMKQGLMKRAIPVDYFEPFTELPPKFIQHSERVFSYRIGMSRSMVLKTDDGLAVFDCFSSHFSSQLKEELKVRFPGESVRWLVYSHNHLDHIRGGKPLNPEHVIGHEDVNRIVADFKHPLNDVLEVNMPVSGDTMLSLGGVEVRMLYMPMSHSSTLYGIYVPGEDTVFAPDMMFVKAMPPFGFPDWYYPGYIRALDRLISLKAKNYIPSHFNLGERNDLIDYRNMMVEYREVVTRELVKINFEPESGEQIRAIFDVAYPELKEKYGDWHGFDAMFIPHFAGQVGASFLGF